MNGELLSLSAMVKAVREGSVTPDYFVRTSLKAAQDDQLLAWAYTAQSFDIPAKSDLPLRGIPFGVKDIIAVHGMPTRAGTAFMPASAAADDAWCVAALRAAGATPIGKLATTAFAFKDPAPTFNPWNRAHTPGGSSAGSAAAVAAGQVPFAFGTQTQGSVVRPASYCGIVGFKPTYGRIPLQGVIPFAPSLDHVGFLCRSAEDALLLARIFDLSLQREPAIDHPRILCDLDHCSELVGAGVREPLRAYAERLRAAGADVRFERLPPEVAGTQEALNIIQLYEGYLAHGRHLSRSDVPPGLRAGLEEGAATTYRAYRAALEERERLRALVTVALKPYDAALMPSAGPAPDRTTTGAPAVQAPWTGFGFPAISLPYALAEGGLPLGAQFAALHGEDARLLAIARWAERVAPFAFALAR